MRQSVRCHGIITPEGVYGNVVISYDGAQLPPHGRALTVTSEHISVIPFTDETHSTVDYNGIVVTGDIDISEVSLTVETLQSVIARIRTTLRPSRSILHFIPFV